MENAINVKKSCLVFGISLLLINTVYAISINEIMYNPEGEDNNKEYIEIYFENYINLTNYKILDLSSEDILKEIKFINSSYALIIEEEFDYNNINASIYSVGKTIGNNLNNEEDFIIIKNPNNTIIDALHYYSEWGAYGNKDSICKINNIWKECATTPGYLNSEKIISQNLTKIKINELLPDPQGYDNAPMPNGEWIELYNEGDNSANLNGFYFQDVSNRKLYISSTTTYNTTIQPKSYLTVYANGFSGLLNNEGYEKIILFSNNSILVDEVSYSNSQEGVSWSKLTNSWTETPPSPGNINTVNFSYSSKVKIEKVYLGSDYKAKFGDIISVKIYIYKANETKKEVELYLENELSKRSSLNIEGVFSNQTFTIPLQIVSNCENKLKDGKYNLILSGLDDTDEKEIEIEGNNDELCEIITKEKIVKEKSQNTQNLKEEKTETFINQNKEAISEINYSSSSVKAKNSALYFFTVILTLLVIELVRKKC